MKHTRRNVGLAIINNKVTSFYNYVFNVTERTNSYYFILESQKVPLFYEELDEQNQWRNVSFPTTAKQETFPNKTWYEDTFLSFPITDTVNGFLLTSYGLKSTI